MDTVRTMIKERLAERGLTMKDASLQMGRAHSYLFQFLKKGLPREMHERERMRLAPIIGVSPDDLRGPSTRRENDRTTSGFPTGTIDTPVRPPYPVTGGAGSGTQGQGTGGMPGPFAGSDLYGNLDLPVYGTAQGGEGALVVTEGAVDWVARPAVLLRVRDGYGIIVIGDSMSPEHKSGSIALVNPHLPPRVGDSCIFRSHAEDGTHLAIIKEFRGETETTWKVRQHTPPKDYTLKKSEWQYCHRTVGNYFP